ncbi:hypothetical protein M885DRAFT_485925 [Pelagophyceae sp. CCMP2097]|nr:hypothetical protein M885DRAFT_485925 [Pelagophyceae sp. CCMP2097]|mmetsp:Transcript_16563/g.55951  ORF Transcript_16563/g.55951 Transcript_16563/m.55951 type:complete len:667 (-) Transcript_16563:219-2219(-)
MPKTWGDRISSVARAPFAEQDQQVYNLIYPQNEEVSSPIHTMLGLGEQSAPPGKNAFTPDGKESRPHTRKLLEVMVPKRDSRITRNSVKRQHKLSIVELRADGTREEYAMRMREVMQRLERAIELEAPIRGAATPMGKDGRSPQDSRGSRRGRRRSFSKAKEPGDEYASDGDDEAHAPVRLKPRNTVHARDLRAIDTSYVHNCANPAIVVRQHVVIVNFNPIRAIIIWDRMLLLMPRDTSADLVNAIASQLRDISSSHKPPRKQPRLSENVLSENGPCNVLKAVSGGHCAFLSDGDDVDQGSDGDGAVASDGEAKVMDDAPPPPRTSLGRVHSIVTDWTIAPDPNEPPTPPTFLDDADLGISAGIVSNGIPGMDLFESEGDAEATPEDFQPQLNQHLNVMSLDQHLRMALDRDRRGTATAPKAEPPSGSASYRDEGRGDDDSESDDDVAFELRGLEAILSVATLRLEAEYQNLLPRAQTSTNFLHSARMSLDHLERLRQIKNATSFQETRARDTAEAITTALDDDEDMCMMQLTLMRNSPEMFEHPLDPEFVMQHEDVELLLESYLQAAQAVQTRLELLRLSIDNAEDLFTMKLDIARNRLITADTIFTLFGMIMATGALVTGFFGMNLDQNRRDFLFVVIIVTVLCVVSAATIFILLIRSNTLVF